MNFSKKIRNENQYKGRKIIPNCSTRKIITLKFLLKKSSVFYCASVNNLMKCNFPIL